MADAKRRKLDAILVWKVDRFGRSLRHLVNAIVELESVGVAFVAFVSFTDNLDLSTPSGWLMFQVIAAMGEFERELIRERVLAGLRNARAKRPHVGPVRNPCRCFEKCHLAQLGALYARDRRRARMLASLRAQNHHQFTGDQPSKRSRLAVESFRCSP
jgi:hypothetical protein